MTHTTSRRQLLVGFTAAIAFASIWGATQEVAAADKPDQEFYELRTYRVANAQKQAIVSDYLKTALLPALNDMGVVRVGVFTVMDDKESETQDHSLYVLIAFPNLEMFAAVNPTLNASSKYRQGAAGLHALTKKDPGYLRIESRLMKAFADMPVMELPQETLAKTERMFEVRIYESHDDLKAHLKVDMFNSGEIDIMREVKLAPVFYGETLIGQDVPNLTYMLSASDMTAHEAHWKAFIGHPEWDRMKKLPKYKDTVSKITKVYLVPTDYSQI